MINENQTLSDNLKNEADELKQKESKKRKQAQIQKKKEQIAIQRKKVIDTITDLTKLLAK